MPKLKLKLKLKLGRISGHWVTHGRPIAWNAMPGSRSKPNGYPERKRAKPLKRCI